MGEHRDEPSQAAKLGRIGERLSSRHLPERQQPDRQVAIVSSRAAAVDAQLPEIEQQAVVELALVDVAPDLRLVLGKVLPRALGVQHEAVGDEIDRREVRLQATRLSCGK